MDVLSVGSAISNNVQVPVAPAKELKTTSVFLRIIKSPLFWTTAAVVGGTFVALALPPAIVPIALITLIASLIIACLANRKWLEYEVSIAIPFNYDQIDDNIYLGRLPLKNRGNHKELMDKVDAILTVTEHYENHKTGIFSDPVTSDDWKTLEKVHKQIEAKDHRPLENEHVKEGIEFLEEQVRLGNKVYVHCKAGCSRSAAIVAGYFARKDGKTVEEAAIFLKEKRPRVKLSPKKLAPVERFNTGVSG